MIGAIRHLSDLDQFLRWTVVAMGLATAAVTVWFCFRDKRHKPHAKVIPIFVSLIAVGISLNYVLRVPVVFPGALFYLVAYSYVILVMGGEMSDARTEGKPGEPGQPGEPGTATQGGAGGHGGTGGRGGEASHIGSRLLGFLVLAAIILAIISGVSLWTAQRVSTNTDRIDRIVRNEVVHATQAEHAIWATDYRICVRQMQLRAALILHVDFHPDRRLLRSLPIFDCTPDLQGKPARKLTQAEARAYLKRFDHHQAFAP